METQEKRIMQAEEFALRDYERASGRIIFPKWITGYRTDSATEDYPLHGRVALRVVENQPLSDILHWNDNWLDPYWDLEEVTPGETLKYLQAQVDPTLKELRSLWTHGFSYHAPTPGKTQEIDTTTIESLKPWWRRIPGMNPREPLRRAGV